MTYHIGTILFYVNRVKDHVTLIKKDTLRGISYDLLMRKYDSVVTSRVVIPYNISVVAIVFVLKYARI